MAGTLHDMCDGSYRPSIRDNGKRSAGEEDPRDQLHDYSAGGVIACGLYSV
jgi:hypothetical protein